MAGRAKKLQQGVGCFTQPFSDWTTFCYDPSSDPATATWLSSWDAPPIPMPSEYYDIPMVLEGSNWQMQWNYGDLTFALPAGALNLRQLFQALHDDTARVVTTDLYSEITGSDWQGAADPTLRDALQTRGGTQFTGASCIAPGLLYISA